MTSPKASPEADRNSAMDCEVISVHESISIDGGIITIGSAKRSLM